jgi:hypothetical protein
VAHEHDDLPRGGTPRPRGRFSKSGHTSHRPLPPPVQYGPPPGYPPQHPYPPPADPYGHTTYHHGSASARKNGAPSHPVVAVGRAAAVHTHRAARLVTRKVIRASKADGAEESGLTALIWNQVLSYGTDAMIVVALAGTVFFGASADAKRGNVLLYLLITMAPFAVVAPVVGPMLDRLQHGRRWAMAGTAIGRAVLALIMAGHATDLLVLYPCALGSLVLSKAYGVLRASAAPRLVPRGMTLTEANARLSIFGLGSTLVLGGVVGVVIKVTGSYGFGLVLTAIGFAVCGYFAFRLPPQVDSAPVMQGPDPGVTAVSALAVGGGDRARPPVVTRVRNWASRGFDSHLIVALQGESVLRLLSGLLTIYLAFYIESTAHGWTAALQLGAVVAAAGAGNFTGTGLGSRIKFGRPELVIVVSTAIAAATCLLVAILFDVLLAVAAMFVSSVANALSKIALDALIQRDVDETQRSSAFARSETFLQLSWVAGAALGVALPGDRVGGSLGFWVAAVIVGAVAVVTVLRSRAIGQEEAVADGPQIGPGSVGPQPADPS